MCLFHDSANNIAITFFPYTKARNNIKIAVPIIIKSNPFSFSQGVGAPEAREQFTVYLNYFFIGSDEISMIRNKYMYYIHQAIKLIQRPRKGNEVKMVGEYTEE